MKIKEEDKDLNYWKNNCEENYMTTPISVLRYITELEKVVNNVDLDDVIIICPECKNAETVEDLIQYTKERNS
tara:strand:- start:521 stop:739 length:219 start_codon:yes stop_codon:yes gene_type:complete